MIWSRSVISAVQPDTCARLSAYCFAKVLISPMGEYFFKMISPSRSVKISSGSASRMRSVRRISFGITILPRSSILLTIPVAFIQKIPPSAILSISGNSICKRWDFMRRFSRLHTLRTISSENFIMQSPSSYAPIFLSVSCPERFWAISSGNLTPACHAWG